VNNKKRKKGSIPPPPPESASERVKAAYYRKHDPVDLIDAGYWEEDGLFKANRRLVDLRPERGLMAIPVATPVARKLHRLACRAGCTPSELATRLLAQDLGTPSRRSRTA
jgi:hypothetical protein